MRSIVKNYMGMVAIAIVAVLILGAVGVRIDRTQELAPPSGIEATPTTSGNAPGGIIDAEWLVQNRSQVDYIFDLSDTRQFEAGHIPGAIHIWWQDAMSIHSTVYGVPTRISAPGNSTIHFGHLNLNVPQDARIVLYDNNNSERASWMLWVITINGYTDAHVLDGGLPAWVGANGELTTDVVDSRDESMVATPTWIEDEFIQGEALHSRLNDDNLSIIDTRSATEQQDTVNGTIREGHIPGSINITTAEVMREDGTFKSPEEMQEIFSSYGLSPDSDIVVYSLFTLHSGNIWLALQLAGFDNVVIYLDGFVGWASDQSLPIETSPYPTEKPAATPRVAAPASTPLPAPTSTPEDEGPTDLTGI